MPPRLPVQLRRHGRQSAIFKEYARSERQSTCLFCSVALDRNRERIARPSKKRASPAPARARRYDSTVATNTSSPGAKIDPRKELESVLLSLQRDAASHVNLSRLQLALNGLRQKRGSESIRVAILGLSDGPTPTTTAKEVLKLLLTDPLKDREAWEREVEQHDCTAPLIIRIGGENRESKSDLSLPKETLLREIHVSSATLDGHNLEILLANTNAFRPKSESGAPDRPEEAVLVPTVDVTASNTGRRTPITTPVHKVLLVADGIRGAASVMSVPTSEKPSVLNYAVNIPEYKPTETSELPFIPIDTGIATIGLGLVRKDIGNAIEYEHLWFQSNLPKVVEWLKADILTTPDDATKPSVRELIASILRNTTASIQTQESRSLKTITHSSLTSIESGLSEWAERAHSELQGELDAAFSSRRWRKLRWWKLFWRVDDVGMLTSDILTQKFLPEAERASIFLAGRMKEAGVSLPRPNAAIVAGKQNTAETSRAELVTQPIQEPVWPTNIPHTRDYLQAETVSALQALAQKLVLQTLSTSGFMTALGALVYVGTLSTTLYEAGAVASLGIVWSMRRMQKQWERARDFWEGGVREEGRKAVRGVEETIASALTESRTRGQGRDPVDTRNDLQKAQDLVRKAERFLEEMK